MGEPYWHRLPDPEYLAREEVTADTFSTHYGNASIAEGLGLTLLCATTSTLDEFDAYESLQWASRHPGNTYLKWGRETMGWGLYAFLKP